MEAKDILRVAEICTFARRMGFWGILSDNHLFVDSSVPHYVGYFERTIKHEAWQIFVHEENGIVVGFMTVSSCDEEKGCLQIIQFYVEPALQGGGIGSRMMRFCKQKATLDGYNKICLWVLEKNAAAIGFYETKGFNADGARRTRKYGDLEAVQMKYTIAV